MTEHNESEGSFEPRTSENKIEPEATPDAAAAVRARDLGSIGRYRLLSKLGEGGMGLVWLAEQTAPFKRRVAVKVIKTGHFDSAALQRFELERQSLAMMDHPAIAKVFDADSTPEGQPYFVMEYVPGLPLTKYCDQNRLTTRSRLELFVKVCEGVQHAHQKAIIHRDLKPSNVLVCEVDGKPTPRVIDFGIAKAISEPSDDETVFTRMGGLVGTPGYMSPEQADPTVLDVDTRTDVYSLGVMLYELLTGCLPFDPKQWRTKPLDQVLRQLREDDPPRPSTRLGTEQQNAIAENRGTRPEHLVDLLRGDLDWIALKAIERDRARRYGTPTELAADIGRYMNNEPVLARPASLRYRTDKFIRRNRRAVTAASVVIAVVVGLVVFFTMRLTRERDNATRQTAIATAINHFLSDDLLGRGNPFQSGKATETLLDAINQASPNIDRKFADEPQVAARLHLTIAQALDNRSNFPEAREEYARAHSLFLQTEGALSQDAIAVQLQRATMEARSFQSGGIPTAKSLVAEQEALLGKIKQPRKDLAVWLLTARGMIALVESDAKSANQFFKDAADAASTLPDFDEIARFNLRQRLAFTYIRLGDGVSAERLARELIAAYTKTSGPDSPYVLRVRLNLAQAFMVERKFPESVQEANTIYPEFLSKFGPDHQLTMQLLATRAQSEGSLGLFTDSLRDDLTIYEIAVKKQGPLSFYAIATLSDAAVAQCRAHDLIGGELNARKAHDAATKAFGPQSALGGGTALPLANCLIDLGKLQEASNYLANIDTKAVTQLTGDPDWGANVTLAEAEISARRGDYGQAQKFIDSVRPVFSRPDAEAYQKQKMDELDKLMGRTTVPPKPAAR